MDGLMENAGVEQLADGQVVAGAGLVGPVRRGRMGERFVAGHAFAGDVVAHRMTPVRRRGWPAVADPREVHT